MAARAPAPGAHGGDGARLAAVLGIDPDEVLDLSASTNPRAPDVAALAARHLGTLTRYPDPAAAAATTAVAEALGVEGDRVLVTNGGAEAIALVAAELATGWVEEPEFSLYRRHLDAIEADGGRWRSNPNNPRGDLAPAVTTAAVWDEAFYPLATGAWTRGDAERGAVVVGSLTKVFRCPGLRAGYVVGPDAALVDRLRRRQPRWAVNGLAAELVPALIEGADLPAWQRAIVGLRCDLADVLTAAGWAVEAADAPWLLVPDARGLRGDLAAAAILVRDCASFGLPGTVRVGVPDEAGLERLQHALAVGRR
ncbi:MAG: aminotransferase class I/II-fold pyridoxal phosphate-dependent enzyme [Acidimicrobiia bacterium]